MAKKEECIACKRAKMGGYAGEIKCSYYGRKPQFDETSCSNFVDAGEVRFNLDEQKPNSAPAPKTAADIINEYKQKENDLRDKIREKYKIEGDISEDQYKQLCAIYKEEEKNNTTTIVKKGKSRRINKEKVWIIAIFLILGIAIGGLFIWNNHVDPGAWKAHAKREPMKYTISLDEDFIFPIFINGDVKSGANVTVFECDENGDKIYMNKFAVLKGTSKTFTARPNVKKIKVHLSFLNVLDFGQEYSGWLPLVYYLSPNENKEVLIDLHVNLYRNEP